MNAYDLACDRVDAARRQVARARAEAARIVAAAENEWEAADAGLARYEVRPGIPLPGYRPGYHEHWRPGEPLVRHCHAAGRTPHEHTPEVSS